MPPKSAPAKTKARSVASRVRQVLITLHLIVGLTAGLLVSLLGLTGSLLVYRHEIDAWTVFALRHVTPQPGVTAPLDQVVAAVRAAVPGNKVRQLSLAEGPTDSHEVSLNGDLRAYVDPYTARVLGTRDDAASFAGKLFALHTKLLAGHSGERIAGWGGFALLALSVSGVVLWWPARWKQLPDRLRIKWRASSLRVHYDLHRTGGFYAAALLILISLTGSALVFDDAFASLAARLTRSPLPAPRPKVRRPNTGLTRKKTTPPLPLAVLLAHADVALPGGVLRRISFPSKPDTPMILRKRMPGDLHPNGMSYVYLDPYTGNVLRVDRADTASAGQHLMNLRYPLHIGQWGGGGWLGGLTRVVHSAAGLMPTVLFVTGVRLWWRRRRTNRAATALVGA